MLDHCYFHRIIFYFFCIGRRVRYRMYYSVIGLAWQKLYYSTVAIRESSPATPLAMWESSDRTLFRIGGGVRQMITKHFGSRLQVFWENTSKLSASFPVPVGQGGVSFPTLEADNYTVRPRDNYSVLFGFFFQVT